MKIQIKHLFGVCETQPLGLDGVNQTQSHLACPEGYEAAGFPCRASTCPGGPEVVFSWGRGGTRGPIWRASGELAGQGHPWHRLAAVSTPPPPGPQTLTLACRPTSAHSPPVLAPSWHQPVLFLLPSQPLVFSFFLSRLGTREVVVDLPQLWAPDVVVIRGKHHTHLADLGTWTSDKRTRHEARHLWARFTRRGSDKSRYILSHSPDPHERDLK